MELEQNIELEVMSAKQAAEYLKAKGLDIPQELVEALIEVSIKRNVFPFWECLKTDDGEHVVVYKSNLQKWICGNPVVFVN